MAKNEYLSNVYRVIFKKVALHFVFEFLEYLIILFSQVNLYTINFEFSLTEKIDSSYFYLTFIQKVNSIPEYAKIIILGLVFVMIIAYFLIYDQFAFERISIFNIIVINVFEIIIFRFLFIFILHILFSVDGFPAIIMVIIYLPIVFLIIRNFLIYHLYYFAPHFIVYPYDYYSSIKDIFYILEKICIAIALQSSIKPFNEFLYLFSYILQICIFLFSIYIFYFKSYCVMSNIFLNKSRFAFVTAPVIINFGLNILGNKNYLNNTFLLISINILFAAFTIIQIFYCPYTNAYIGTNDNYENLYYYFYIIDNLKNENFFLEEKVRVHFNKCQKCDMCNNLKEHLSKEKCYKNVYKILYKKVGVLEHTINELIHTILIKGKEGVKHNSFFLINLMYCYYINMNKKNYVLSFNLKLIFEYINEENKNILENHLLSTEQIILINDFLSKADNIMNKMQTILTESSDKEKIQYFFGLYDTLSELKSQKFRNKLYYNKNEGVISFYKYISICSMIYEEIFNTSLSNGGMTLKENQMFLDDLCSKNSATFYNQIIIHLNLLSFENKIIYITGDFAKYKGKKLCQLIPNAFKVQEILLMKKKIMNSKFLKTINKDKDFFEHNNINKGKNAEEQFINLNLLMYDEIENKKYFVIFTLGLNLIYPLNISKEIMLMGFYTVDKNIVIALDKGTKESKKEIVLNADEDNTQSELQNYSANEAQLIKYKNDSKYFHGKKLHFIKKFYVNPNCYNIYSIFHSEKQRTYRADKIMGEAQKKNNLYDYDSKDNIHVGAESVANFNFMMQSQASSTFMQITNESQNYKKRDKGGKKENKKTRTYIYYQFGLIFFNLGIFIFQIISHVILSRSIVEFDNQNFALIMLKNYYGVFNNVFTSILSISCLSENSKGDSCESVVSYFERIFLSSQGFSPDLKKFFFEQNRFDCVQITGMRQRLLQILSSSNDDTLNNLINSEMMTFSISQNITQNGTKLILNKQTGTFIDVFNYMTTAFVVMNSKYENLTDIVYIITKVNYLGNWTSTGEPFINVKLNGQLSQYQYYFYYIILNYQQFMQKLEIITLNLIQKTTNLIKSNIYTTKTIIIIILCAHIILHFSIYLYIQSYFKALAKLFNKIENKLNLKNEEISVRDLLLQKVEKLKIIISLYKQDIYQAIVDLNFIYDNYKKFVEEKNKEIAKYLKKEKYSFEKNYKSKNKKNKILSCYIYSVKSNKFYIYLLFIFIILSIAIAIILFSLWIPYESVYDKISELIKIHGNLAGNSNKFINYYQLMLYNSISLDDINTYERLDTSKGLDLFSKLYTDIENLYEAKKYMENLKHYSLNDIDEYFNFTCATFFEHVFTTNSFASRGANIKYKSLFIKFCQSANIFKSNNYKQIFSMLFEMIQTGINQINNHTYDGLIIHKKSLQFIKTTMIFLIVYYYTFEILGVQIQRKSYAKLSRLFGSNIHIGFVFYYIISIAFLLIIILIYVYKVNRNYRKIHEMKNVFKICNSVT